MEKQSLFPIVYSVQHHLGPRDESKKKVNPMNHKKTKNQFRALINDCSETVDSGACLLITSESTTLSGISKNKLLPQSAIVVIRYNGQSYVKGRLDGVAFEFSSIEGLNASKSILLGIDCRSKKNNIIYYQSDNTIGMVSSNSSMNTNDSIYIFWEYGPNVCLTICAFDPIRNEVVREVVSAQDEPMKNFLRAVLRQSLPSIETENEDDENLLDLDDDLDDDLDEEELYNAAEWN